MKIILLIACFFVSGVALCQPDARFKAIDARVRSIGYFPLEELTKKITAPYATETDKARAIFAWIVTHISYDDKEYTNPDSTRYDRYKYGLIKDPVTYDSLWDAEYAVHTLKLRKGICGEYAALFKAMCSLASVKSVIIEGNGKWREDIGGTWGRNHAWNAVFLNNKWQLLDVTWAAEEPEKGRRKAAPGINDFYYCTPPALFINNHYPDSLKWTLLANPISRAQFQNGIYFNYENAGNIKVISAIPKIGMLKKKVGDSISFEITSDIKCTSVELILNDSLSFNFSPYSITQKQHGDNAITFPPVTVDTLYKETGKMDIVNEQHFNQIGDRIFFRHYIKRKGDFMLYVYLNEAFVMTYRLLVE